MLAAPNPLCPAFQFQRPKESRQSASTRLTHGCLACIPADLHDPLATSKMGITLRGLRALISHLREAFGNRLGEMSTTELNKEWVEVVTAPRRCRLLEMPQLVNPDDVQKPMYFISHSWANRALHMFEFVLNYLQDASETVSVWIDILCVNQHEDTRAHQLDVHPHAFTSTIKACSAGTIVVLDAEGCSPATRAWCLFEWAHTLSTHGPDGLHMMLDPAYRAAVFTSINVTAAQAFKAEDKTMIMEEVRKHHGSAQRFDDLLKLQLLLEPLSYAGDVRRLQQQAAATETVWNFEPVDNWLASSSRALCIAAGAGEGKSTIAAALVGRSSKLVGRSSKLGSEGAATAMEDAQQQTLAAVSAHHFLKYNDQRRLDTVRIIKSLAFQLACRYPSVCQHLLQLDVAKVAQLADAKEAFELLLLEPARQHCGAVSASSTGDSDNNDNAQPIVLLIDALDEADPLALQLLTSSNDGAAQQQKQYPTVCGNKALNLVTEHLVQLPSTFRFVFTTRPDAAAGQVLPCLHRTFAGSVTLVTARELRRNGMASHDGKSTDSEVMVYHSAAAALHELRVEVAQPEAAQPAGAPTLHDVYSLYARIFEATKERNDDGVSDLLSVLMAAQEPPSQSFLQQLGLGDAVRLLPGYPRLFFVDEHHVYTLHKSLGDWLLNPELSGPHAVQPQRGHELIGLHLARLWRESRVGDMEVKATTTGNLSYSSKYLANYLPEYLPKYAVTHLAAAAAKSPPAVEALDELLYDLHFLHAVASARRLGSAITALAGMAEQTSRSYNILRWLQAEQHELVGKSLAEVALHALRTGRWPLTDRIEQEAAAIYGGSPGPWKTRLVLPERGWSDCQFVLQGHSGAVTSVAFSPDGKQLASCSEDTAVRVWDAASGQYMAILKGHSNMVTSVVFSPDGKQLASGSYDETVRVWDAASGQCTATLQGLSGRVSSLAFSPDGKQLASGNEGGTIQVWDVASSQCTATLQGHFGWVASVAFSPDGKQLASGGEDMALRVWGVAPGQCTAVLQGHSGWVGSVAFSPDGKQLASGGEDTTVRIWDTVLGQCTATLQGHSKHVLSVAFSPDGKQLASGGDTTVRVWDTALCQCTATLQDHFHHVQGVAFSPDGKQLASGSSIDNTVRVWRAASGKYAAIQRCSGWVAVTFSPDGKQLSCIGEDNTTTQTWDAMLGQQCTATRQGGHDALGALSSQDITFSQQQVRWNPDDDTIIPLWDAALGECKIVLRGHSDSVACVVFSLDFKQVASGSFDKTVRMWDAGSGQCVATLMGHSDTVRTVAFSFNGKYLASGSADMTVRVWNAQSGQCTATLQGHSGMVQCVAFSLDGKHLASGSYDETVRVWDTNSGQCFVTLQGHSRMVACVAFSSDGKKVGSGSADKTVRVWDVESSQCTATLQGHSGIVISVAFGHDGKHLASGSYDGTVRVWREVE